MFEAVDHVGVAVEDLDAAIELYSESLGMPLQHRETVSEQGVEAALLGVGDSHVELLFPLGDETPVGRFIAKRGPGLHHTAYRCRDVALLIDEQPRRGIRDSRVAFLHPASTGGVLTELVQPAGESSS
jgi:methylmalonyl-CoA epimerase